MYKKAEASVWHAAEIDLASDQKVRNGKNSNDGIGVFGCFNQDIFLFLLLCSTGRTCLTTSVSSSLVY
jgi:hypothetical protein